MDEDFFTPDAGKDEAEDEGEGSSFMNTVSSLWSEMSSRLSGNRNRQMQPDENGSLVITPSSDIRSILQPGRMEITQSPPSGHRTDRLKEDKIDVKVVNAKEDPKETGKEKEKEKEEGKDGKEQKTEVKVANEKEEKEKEKEVGKDVGKEDSIGQPPNGEEVTRAQYPNGEGMTQLPNGEEVTRAQYPNGEGMTRLPNGEEVTRAQYPNGEGVSYAEYENGKGGQLPNGEGISYAEYDGKEHEWTGAEGIADNAASIPWDGDTAANAADVNVRSMMEITPQSRNGWVETPPGNGHVETPPGNGTPPGDATGSVINRPMTDAERLAAAMAEVQQPGDPIESISSDSVPLTDEQRRELRDIVANNSVNNPEHLETLANALSSEYRRGGDRAVAALMADLNQHNGQFKLVAGDTDMLNADARGFQLQNRSTGNAHVNFQFLAGRSLNRENIFVRRN
jgi:hypothetical protein